MRLITAVSWVSKLSDIEGQYLIMMLCKSTYLRRFSVVVNSQCLVSLTNSMVLRVRIQLVTQVSHCDDEVGLSLRMKQHGRLFLYIVSILTDPSTRPPPAPPALTVTFQWVGRRGNGIGMDRASMYISMH